MLHLLRKHLPLSFRHQCLLSVNGFAATASADSAPFAVADYLVATCGLTRDRAVKASKVLSHLKSPSKPDAVLALLSDAGLSPLDVAAAVDRYPKLLCCKVKTLAPRVAELRELGLSSDQISRFVALNPAGFPLPSSISKLRHCIILFGSMDNILSAIKRGSFFLHSDIKRVVKPNVSLLRECGLSELDISRLCRVAPKVLSNSPQRVQAIVARVEGIGVPRGTRMFKHALIAGCHLSEENLTAMVEFLKETFHWSDNQVRIAVSKNPNLLSTSKDREHRVAEFLICEVGLDPEYIAHRPALIKYSLEGRLMPRYYVVRFLKANGLLKHDRDYYGAVSATERVFVEKYIARHKEAAPHLSDDYADACKGKVPSRFRPQELRTGLGLANV